MNETDINATVNVTEDIYADVDSTAMSAAVIDDGDSIVVPAEVDFGHTLDTELEDNDLIDVPVDESVGIAGDHRVLLHRDAPNQHPMSAITGLNDTIAGINTALSSRISQVEAETADLDVDMADALLRIGDLQDQVDGNITTWFYAAEPAMNLPPVAFDPSNPHDTGWDTDEKKNEHKGDLYYNTLTGYAYRFAYADGAYGWLRITDTDVVKALADAARAQDTADSKRRVFYTTPYPPYDKGDLWVQGSTGDILVCSTSKPADGSYDFADWSRASKYTDDTVADIALASANGKNTVYHQASQPTGGTYKKGDTWFDTDDDYTMYTYDGSLWIKEQFGNEAIADLSITNAKIANATIEYGKIKSIDAGKITVGDIAAVRMKTNSIEAINTNTGTVKISADKVNIDGAAIFTSGRLSQSSLDGAYDANGAAADALSDAQSYADGAAADALTDAKGYADTAVSGKANKTDAVARQQRIYYRKTTSGAPSKNTTWLTTSGTGYGNWSLKIPQMTSGTTKYPYLYTAVQTQTVSQLDGTACSCSDVLLDDTTTVIDGGTIITGTVNANAVNASSGTFDTANIPNLDAGKITSGYINAARIEAGSIGVGKIDATSGTFDTANIPDLNASKITAGDISADRLKVNAISAINSNTGSVQISASKVDIAGAAVFNNYSTTTQMNTAIGNAVDGIEFGGRNLYPVKLYNAQRKQDVQGSVSGVGYVLPQGSGDVVAQSQALIADQWTLGDEYIVSFYAWSTGGSTTLSWDMFPDTYINVDRDFEITTSKTKFTSTFTLSNSTGSLVTPIYTRFWRLSSKPNYAITITDIKIEKGNKATDWTPAPEDVQAEIDGIDVGGRNRYSYSSTSLWGYKFSVAKDASINGITATRTGNDNFGIVRLQHVIDDVNSEWTVSFDVKGTGSGEVYADICDTQIDITKYPRINISSDYQHYVGCVKPTQVTSVYDFVDITADVTVTALTIKNIKVEKGNKATDWTPAPEDVQAEIDAKKSIHTVSSNYRWNYADILTNSAEGKSGYYVVNSTAGIKTGDTVRIKVAVLDMSDAPVYMVTTVTNVVNATDIQVVAHGLDTTIIDGGKILTNSIGANQIAANAITSDELAANSVIADKIATDAVTANKIAANTITSDKLKIGDTANYSELSDDTASYWGFTADSTADGHWYTMNTVGRDRFISNYFECKGGESFRITFDISTSAQGYETASSTSATYLGTAIGVYAYNDAGTSVGIVYSDRVTASASAPATSVATDVTIATSARKFRIFVQTNGTSNFSGTIKIRNVRVYKRYSGELIVDGAITANKLAANSITVGNMNPATSAAVLNSNIEVGGRNYAITCLGDIPIGTVSTNNTGVTATLTGAATFTLNGTTSATTWFFNSAKVFCGIELDVGTYKVWCTLANINLRVGSGSSATYFAGIVCGTKESPATLTISTKQVYWFTPYAEANKTFSNQTAQIMIEKGTKTTDWSPAPEDMQAYADNAVDEIEIGGRNLLPWSKLPSARIIDYTAASNGKAISLPTGTGTSPVVCQSADLYSLISNKFISLGSYVTVSFMAVATGTTSLEQDFYPDTFVGYFQNVAETVTTTPKRYVHTGILENSGTPTNLYLRFWRLGTSSNYAITIWDIKIESGNKVTDWTPAPEDTNSAINTAATKATNYITHIDNNGIRVHPSSTENNSVVINASGMEVFKGGTTDAYSVAKYGDTARIGKPSSARFLINATSLQAYDSSNAKYFEITNGGMTGNLITAGKISSASGDVYFDLDNNELACSSVVGKTTSANMGGYTYGSTYYGYFRVYNSTRGTYGLYIEPNGSEGDVWISADNRLILEAAPVGTKDGTATKITIGQNKILMRACNGSTQVASIDFGYGLGGNAPMQITGNTLVTGTFTATGTKSRAVDTKTYDSRLLYCYETPTPLFGDIGEAVIDEDGLCYVDIDDIFSETVAGNVEYQVFLQKEGQGDCWVADKQRRYFVIEGTPSLKVAWEMKAKQKDYQNIRLEKSDNELDEYEYVDYAMFTLDDFINEQEELLYGNY